MPYCVFGGGGGGYAPTYAGSGGGGGGVHYKTSISASVATYPVTVGAGGATGAKGWSHIITIVPGRTADGGGRGGAGNGDNGQPGGSGGGGTGYPAGTAGPATGASGHPGGIDIASPTPNANGWGMMEQHHLPPEKVEMVQVLAAVLVALDHNQSHIW